MHKIMEIVYYRNSLNSKTATDPVLGGFVGVFISADILLCLVWTSVGPLRQSNGIRTVLLVATRER